MLAARAGRNLEEDQQALREGPFGAPLAELAMGVAMMLAALSIAWLIARSASDAPPPRLTSAETGTCVASCSLTPPAEHPDPPRTALPAGWRWTRETYRFDDIYGQTPYPAAYSFDFVYRRPQSAFTAR